MKTYTLRMEDGKSYVMDDAICDELNRTQGRVRLKGGELDKLVMAQVGLRALEDGTDGLEDYAKARNQWRKLRPALKLMSNVLADLTDHIDARQFITVYNNFNAVNITVSALPVTQFTNIRQEDLSELVTAASLNCAATCLKTREESKRCRLRKAFESIPGLKKIAKQSAIGLGECPYMTMGEMTDDD